MSEIEKMKAYSEKTGIPFKVRQRYGLCFGETLALAHYKGPIDSVCMAFSYGMAKGYRAGVASMKKGASA